MSDLVSKGPKTMKPNIVRRIKMNIWGNWNGYIGRNKVREFGGSEFEAVLWVNGEL